MKKRILVVNPYYLPGYKSGGPQRTVQNICEVLGEACDIYILTQNIDLGSTEPYAGIHCGEWVKVGNAKVKYLSMDAYGFQELKGAYQEFDNIYLCELLQKSSYTMLLIHWMLGQREKNVYLAPMGAFSKGALKQKALKKKLFLFVCKFVGLYKNITWSYSSEREHKDATSALGHKLASGRYVIAEDLPRSIDFCKSEESVRNSNKKCGNLKVVFLSRICEMKNLLKCIDVLQGEFVGQIDFDIYGTVEDKVYWDRCQEQLKHMPANVQVTYRGEVSSECVIDVLRGYDVFFLPTKGENFGHAIYEALGSGCVALISNNTPWKGFEEAQCGAIHPLEDIEGFGEVLQYYLDCDKERMQMFRNNAIQYAREKYFQSVDNSGYKEIFM